jgi:beta-glucosidase
MFRFTFLGLLFSSIAFSYSLPYQLPYHALRQWTSSQSKNEVLIDAQVKALVSQMSLEEKAGQMTQMTLGALTSDGVQIDNEKLKEALLNYHIGSVLNVSGDQAFSIDHWHEVITDIQTTALKDRFHIPVIYGIDSIHGAHYTQGATIFPQSINMAATWTPDLHKQSGSITAFETRASGIPWNFFPILDIGRQPLWPRFFETYGEDVYLAEAMAKANISGQQGEDLSVRTHVAACMKHFLGYSDPRSGKDKTPAIITEKMMREYFLPTFAGAVETGAETVMINSGEIDGVPGHVNYHLITEILKQELGFKGFAVSDWADIKKLYERDHLAVNEDEAIKMTIMAGVDMSMVPFDYDFTTKLIALVQSNQIPMSRIDDAVSRILRVKFLLGLFDNPFPDPLLKSKLGSEESAKINQYIASESITLVKNNVKNNLGVLPLKPDQKILVTGPGANSLSMMNGGWTITWQGDRQQLYPKNKKTVFKALQDRLGADKVQYAMGIKLNEKNEDYDQALNMAKLSDVIVLCLGEKPYTEIPGDIDDLTLDEVQLQYARDLYATGKPVVLLMLEGRPRIIKSIESGASAIVLAYLPGMEGGLAITDVLTGVVNPSGKLPFSYPRSPNDLLHYDHKYQEETEDKTYNPQWPFGFGLSYTNFAYSDLQMDKSIMVGATDELHVSVRVKNTGLVVGKEVVQLYLSDLYRSEVTPPVKELKGFQKITLAPNESQVVNFKLNLRDLSYIGRKGDRVAEPGVFKIQIDKLSDQFELK